jgi:multiple sugar transport system ATP-binding protein
MNVAAARVSESAGSARVALDGAAEGFSFPGELLARLGGQSQGRDLALGIRPEGVLVAREAADGFLAVEAQLIEPLGSHDIVDLRIGSQLLRARTRSGFVRKAGDVVFARIDPAQAHFFDTQSGSSLGIRLVTGRAERAAGAEHF